MAKIREALLSGVALPTSVVLGNHEQIARVLQAIGLQRGWLTMKRIGSKYHIVDADGPSSR